MCSEEVRKKVQIKALKALTIRVSESGDLLASENEEIGNLVSIAHGAIAEVPEAVGESLINDSLAEKVTEGNGGSDVVKGIVERTITNITADMLAGVTSIGIYAFAMFESLESIEIPGSVTSIGAASFMNCSNLANVTIGNGITSIGDVAFVQCPKLTSITVLATTPPILGSEPFDSSVEGFAIYVPAESVGTYKAASGWSSYEGKIQAIPS